jgi:hypothetical protein
MPTLARVNLPSERMPVREACDRAFVLACCYSGGWDLVEEMVASNFWPLRKWNQAFHIKMV